MYSWMRQRNLFLASEWRYFRDSYKRAERSKILCALDDYSTKNTQKYFKHLQSLSMIT
jgi:hypothetical protein